MPRGRTDWERIPKGHKRQCFQPFTTNTVLQIWEPKQKHKKSPRCYSSITALVFSVKEEYLHFYAGLFGFMDQADAEKKKKEKTRTSVTEKGDNSCLSPRDHLDRPSSNLMCLYA
jgi:hypothetical protein